MLRTYQAKDEKALLKLWNRLGIQMGYAPMDTQTLHRLILDHPDFSPGMAFLLTEGEQLRGFCLGCVQGKRGHVACVLAQTGADTGALLTALEGGFREAGCSESTVSFWCPIRLPWLIPGTEGHQHNNVPGAALDWEIYKDLLALGYQSASREVAMHLNLQDFQIPRRVLEKQARMEAEGYTVAKYDGTIHQGLEEMLSELKNPLWQQEIPTAAREGKYLLVGLKGTQVAGFAGPIYPEESGRGYFSGIGVAPEFEGHGLGSLLFYRLCQGEKEAGAAYMSLFTGEENPARKIYEGAGFTPCRNFDVMRKAL